MLTDADKRRHLIDTTVVGLLSVGLYAFFPAFSDIYRLWRRDHGLAIIGGLGQGYFEYPPLAALYFEPLSWLPSSRMAVIVNGLVMVAAAVAITWVLLKRIDTETSKPDVRMWAMSPAVLFLLPVGWDVAVALLAVVAVVALYAERVAKAGALLGAGTSFKVFPGVMVLPSLPLLNGWRRRLSYLVAGFVVLVGSYAIMILVWPETWRVHLDFAASRSDHELSLWGLLEVAGLDFTLDTVNVLATSSVVVALLGTTFWVARRKPTFVQAAVVSLVAFLLFSKVYKPQYVLWLLPFLAWNRSDRKVVRSLELASLVQISVTYFPLPFLLAQIAALVRVAALVLLATPILRKRPRNRSFTSHG